MHVGSREFQKELKKEKYGDGNKRPN